MILHGYSTHSAQQWFRTWMNLPWHDRNVESCNCCSWNMMLTTMLWMMWEWNLQHQPVRLLWGGNLTKGQVPLPIKALYSTFIAFKFQPSRISGLFGSIWVRRTVGWILSFAKPNLSFCIGWTDIEWVRGTRGQGRRNRQEKKLD